MSLVKASGVLGTDPHRVVRGYDNNGPYVEYTWRGTKSYCEAIFNTVGAQFDSQEITHDGGVYEVHRRLNMLDNGEGEVPQDEIRMSSKREERDILSHTAFDGFTVDEMIELEKCITEKTKPSWGDDWAGFEDAQKIFELAFRGVKSYPVELPVITRTLTASRWYEFTISYEYCGGIISPDYILTHLNLTFDWPFNLRSDTDPETNPLDLHWGWLKNSPDYSITANRKAVYTQTFEYGLWAAAIYGQPVESPE